MRGKNQSNTWPGGQGVPAVKSRLQRGSSLLWDALSSRAECIDFHGASEGSDAFRALGTCSSFCLRLKDRENVNKQLCTLHAETDSTFGVTSRRRFLKTRALPPHPALAPNGLYTQLVAKFLRKSFGWIL